MKSFCLIVVTLIFCNIHIPFIPSSDFVVNFVYDVSQYSLLIFLFGFIFYTTPSEDYKTRGSALLMALMYINLTLNTIYDKLDLALFYVQYPIGIFLFIYLIASTLRWKPSNEYDINDLSGGSTYFIFKHPKSFLDFTITLFKQPVSSFSIMSNGHWYRFSRNKPCLYRVSAWDVGVLTGYSAFLVPAISPYKMCDVLGTPWKLKESNCITAFKYPLESIGVNLGRFDFIPSIFAYKYFRGKYGI